MIDQLGTVQSYDKRIKPSKHIRFIYKTNETQRSVSCRYQRKPLFVLQLTRLAILHIPTTRKPYYKEDTPTTRKPYYKED